MEDSKVRGRGHYRHCCGTRLEEIIGVLSMNWRAAFTPLRLVWLGDGWTLKRREEPV